MRRRRNGLVEPKQRRAETRDAGVLYDKLRDAVLPLYHGNRGHWIWMMKQAISKIGPSFNSHWMMRRYVTEAFALTGNERCACGM